MFRSVLPILLLAVLPPLPVRGQSVDVVLVGSVVDQDSLRPIHAVTVIVDEQREPVFTDLAGDFALVDLESGTHVLELRKPGYFPRRFRFNLNGNTRGEVFLGHIALVPIPVGVVTVTGTLADARTGDPVMAAPVGLNGRTVGVTEEDGSFRVVSSHVTRQGTNRLTIRRIGYEPLNYHFQLRENQRSLHVALTIDRLAVELPEIVVEGDRILVGVGHMAGFYRRRSRGGGQFLTRSEFQVWNPKEVSDVLRRLSGVEIQRQGSGSGQTRIRLRGSGSRCPDAIVYIDGVRTVSADLDFLLTVESLEAVEVYSSGSRIPPDFVPPSGGFGSCGVVGLWTQ